MRKTATLEQVAKTFARLGYKPQHLAEFHLDRRRIKLLSGGEGAGKSLGGALDVVGDFPFWKLGYIVGPNYEQCRKEFSYIGEALTLLGATDASLISEPEKGKKVLRTVLGQRVETISTEKGTKAVTGTGESPDWILLVEAGKVSHDIFLACRGRVARRRGKLIITGTIEESERWYPELIARWQSSNIEEARSFIVPTWHNRVMYPGGENDAEIVALRSAYTPDAFKERFGGEPSPPASLILKEFAFATHVHDAVRFLPDYPVEIAIDPGYDGSFYAVEFIQELPRAVTRQYLPNLPEVSLTDVWVIDEVYVQHAIHEDVILQAQALPCWQNVQGGVGDVVMKTHPMAGRAPIEIWLEKTKIYLRGEYIKVHDGIDRHRTFLRDPDSKSPRLFFSPKCRGATGEYGRWKRRKLGENLWGDPEKINCDALKAIHYWLIDRFGYVDRREQAKKEKGKRKIPIMAARQRGLR